jgi:hypothetical protein
MDFDLLVSEINDLGHLLPAQVFELHGQFEEMKKTLETAEMERLAGHFVESLNFQFEIYHSPVLTGERVPNQRTINGILLGLYVLRTR